MASPSTRTLFGWMSLALVVIALDQLTKLMVQEQIRLGDVISVTSYFNLVHMHNTGAAFSFLHDASGWQRWFFVALGLSAAGFIVVMLRRHGGQRLFALALALILGGALGNVADRLVHGHVIDFLQFHWAFLEPLFHGGYFPAFNVADSAITAGAACLILDELRRVRRS